MVKVQREDFSVDQAVRMLKSPAIGAVCIYLGTVRQFPQGAGLEFKDKDFVVPRLEEVERKALQKFEIKDVVIVHRIGFLGISENILLIAVSAAHRQAAFDACQSIIDDIKDFHKSWGREVSR